MAYRKAIYQTMVRLLIFAMVFINISPAFSFATSDSIATLGKISSDGETLEVVLDVNNVPLTDIVGINLILYYNPEVVIIDAVSDITVGDIFGELLFPLDLFDPINNTEGYIDLPMTKKVKSPLSSSSGTLLSVTFKVVGEGDANIRVSNMVISKSSNQSDIIPIDYSGAVLHEIYDSTPPVVSLTSSIPTLTNSNSLELSGTYSDISIESVYVLVNKEIVDKAEEDKATIEMGSSNWSKTINLTEGTNAIKIVAYDTSGLQSNELSETVVLDSTKPEVIVFSPENNSYTGSTLINVSGKVNDQHPDKVLISLNGGLSEEVIIETDGSFEKEFTLLEKQANTISIIGIDEAGNTSDEVILTVTHSDSVVPLSIGIQEINSSDFTNTGTLTISGNTIPSVVLTAELTNPSNNKSAVALVVDAEGAITGTITLPTEGVYSLDIVATAPGTEYVVDGTQTITFTYDKTNPQITITGVKDSTTYNIPVIPVINVNETNLDQMTATRTKNDQPSVAFTSGTTINESGTYLLEVTAVDKAGNTVTKTVQFVIISADLFERLEVLLNGSGDGEVPGLKSLTNAEYQAIIDDLIALNNTLWADPTFLTDEQKALLAERDITQENLNDILNILKAQNFDDLRLTNDDDLNLFSILALVNNIRNEVPSLAQRLKSRLSETQLTNLLVGLTDLRFDSIREFSPDSRLRDEIIDLLQRTIGMTSDEQKRWSEMGLNFTTLRKIVDTAIAGGAEDSLNELFRVLGFIEVDEDAPEITSVTPIDGTIVNTGKPTISAVVSEGESGAGIDSRRIEMKVNGTTVTPSYNSSSGLISYKPTVALEDGLVTVSLKVYDLAGNLTQINWAFTIDTVAQLNVAFHDAFGPLKDGDSYQVIALGESEATVTVRRSIGSETTELNEDSLGIYVASFTVEEGDDYSGTFTVEMVDRVGNTKTLETGPIVIDTIAPVITEANIDPDTAFLKEGDTLTVSFRPGDSNDSNLLATFQVAGEEEFMYYDETNGMYNGTLEIDEDMDFEDEAVTITAEDEVGHKTTAIAGTITVDNQAPKATLTRTTGDLGLKGIYKTAVNVKIETETDATIFYVIRTDGEEGLEQTAIGSVDLTFAGQYEYRVDYYAVDLAGNKSNEKDYRVKVDTLQPTTPTLVINDKDGGVINSNTTTKVGKVNITATSEENSKIELAVNGQPQGKKDSGSTFNSVTLKRGLNVITARATDEAGNTSEVASVNVTYDDVAPAFKLAVEKTGDSITRITATTSDTDVVDSTVKLTVKIGSTTPVTNQVMEKTATGVYQTETDLTLTGDLRIEVVAADAVPNTSTTTYEEKKITASEGGSASSQNAEVIVGENGFNEDGTLRVEDQETEYAPEGEDPAGTTLEVTYATDSGEPATVTGVITGTVRYPVPEGWDPAEYMSRFSFKYLDEETNTWILLGGETDQDNPNGWYRITIVPDPATNVGPYELEVEVFFKHFSKYTGFVDFIPPTLDITSPTEGSIVNGGATTVSVTGTTEPEALVKIFLNGIEVNSFTSTDGQLNVPLSISSLVDGQENTITVRSSDRLNNTSTKTILVDVDKTAPILQVTAPVNDLFTNKSNVTITGTTESGASVVVKVGDATLATGVAGIDGSFALNVNLANGLNAFIITAADDAGNISNVVTKNVTRDTTAPTITLTNTQAVVTYPTITINGTVSEPLSGLTVSVNGGVPAAVTVLGNLTFTTGELALGENAGVNTITFTATDRAGNKSNLVYNVTFNPAAPEITLGDIPVLTNQAQLTLTGTSVEGASITVKRNGTTLDVKPSLPSDGAFETTITLEEGANNIEIIAIKSGVKTSRTVNVTLDTTPPALDLSNTASSAADGKVTVVGITNEPLAKVSITGINDVDLDGASDFSIPNVPVPNYSTTITVTITDLAGNTTTRTITVINSSLSSGGGGGGGGFGGGVITGPATGEANPAQGGTISYDNGNVVLTIPAGAVAQVIDVSIDAFELTDEQKAALAKVFGSAVTITSATTDTKQNVSTFGRALTITFKYSASDLGGTNESDLKVAYWHEALKTWVFLPTVAADGEAKASVNHFTTFALIAPKSDVPQANFDKQGTTNAVKIAGTASANATVHVFINGKMLVVTKADASGKYAVTAGPLKAGINSVFVHDPNKNAASVEQIVTYTPTALSDIASHWAKENIGALVQLGVLTGYPEGEFKPEQSVTRAEFIAMVVRAAGIPVDMNADVTTFADANELGWAMPYVAAAYKLGLVTGYQENGNIYFKPNKAINRAELAIFVSRAIQLLMLPAPSGDAVAFNDELPAWAKAQIELAARYGIITGFEDGSFKALKTATRAETATMIIRMLNLVK